MPADARGSHLRLAAPDHRAVGTRAADFDEDAVGDVFVEQRARDPRRRTRQHREDRAPFDLGDVHHAAVAAHDHQRGGDARVGHGARGDARGAQHARQDRGVERGGARTRAQAVLRRHLRAAGRREPAVPRRGDERVLALRAVDRERLADGDGLDAGFTQRVEHVRVAAVEPQRREANPFGQCERREAGERARDGAAERDDAYLRDVAFEQRVRGLRRRVRDERNRRRVDRMLAQELLEPRDDPRRDPVGMVVRRRLPSPTRSSRAIAHRRRRHP